MNSPDGIFLHDGDLLAIPTDPQCGCDFFVRPADVAAAAIEPRALLPSFRRLTMANARRFCISLALFTLAPAGLVHFARSEGSYRFLKEIRIGGEGGWDYLSIDAAARRLYVSHANKVVVIDLDNAAVAGDIADTPGVHGIALAPELNRGFTSNGREGTVSIFDLKTLQLITKVKDVGENPDAILYDTVTKRVFTFNGRSHDATAIDAATGKLIGKVPLSGKPEFGVSTDAGEIFVNIEDKSEITVIDPQSLKVKSVWPLAP